MTTMKMISLMLLHSVLAASAFQAPLPITRSISRVSALPQQQQRSHTALVLSLSDDEELPKFSSDIVPKDDENTTKSSATTASTATTTSKTKKPKKKRKSDGKLLEQLDEFGQSLKPKAQEVNLRAGQLVESNEKKKKIGLKLKACLYYTLYMGYRGYRGFFVILPAVFREVYQKMETAVDFRVLDDESPTSTNSNATATANSTGGSGDVNPDTGNVRWRTKITVSVLAGIVTLTYVLGGLARVLVKFVKTILSTSSLSGSFSAAADEVEGNEDRMMKLSGNNTNNGKGKTNMRNVNGSGGGKDMGF